MPESSVYPYRWAILALVFLVHCVLNGAILVVAGMAAAVMPAFGIGPSEFALVASVPFLAGFVFGIPSGAWADRTSIRLVMSVGLAVATAGAVGRVFATDFASLFIWSFVMGFALAALNANSAKLLRLWFPGRLMGFAMGVYVAGATIGSAVAIGIGPSVPSIQTGFWAVAALMAFVTILWVLFAKRHPDGEGSVAEPVIAHLGAVLKCRNLWIASVLMFFILGLSLVENSFMSVGLNLGKGVEANEAALLTSLTNVSVSLGGFFLPVLAARIGRMRPCLMGTAIAAGALVLAGWFLPFSLVSYGIFFVQGVMMGGLIPLAKTLPALLPDIKPEHMGAAGGVQSMFQNLGAFVVPSYLVTPLAVALAPSFGDNEYTVIFIGAACICVIIAFVAMFLPETGVSPDGERS